MLPPPLPVAVDSRVAFSRYLASSESWGKPIEHRPIRMLLVLSDPSDLGTSWPDLIPVDKAFYQQDLDSRFQPLRRYGQIAYDVLAPASPENLHRALQDGYDVLLYFGHGLQHPTYGPHLLLENHTTGRGELYDGTELVRRMKLVKDRPALVILVACDTAAQPARLPGSTTDDGKPELLATTSLAAQLVQEGGVPAVLAMQRLVEISLARVFSAYLGDQLLQHGIIDTAVNAARQRVFDPESVGWSTPVLYMRSQYGRLFSSNPRLEYALAILGDKRFSRWKGSESDFIDLEVLTLPPGQTWSVLRDNPHDAPSTQDALDALKQFVSPDGLLSGTTEQPTTLLSLPSPEQKNLVALIGPPHSGTTVLLQRLAFDLSEAVCCRSEQDEQAMLSGGDGFLGRPIGIFVSLEEYEKQQALSGQLRQLIIKSVSELVPGLGKDLELLFQIIGTNAMARPGTPRYVFLLDGLDAVSETYRLGAAREIIELANYLPDQRVIVSCNQNFFPTQVFRQSRVMVIQPLNERLVMRYLEQRDPANGMRMFRQIVENGLLRLTTEPALLTTIYRLMTRKDFETLTRNQLVQAYVNQTLEHLPPGYTQGDVIRKTLMALSWYSRWSHQDVIPLDRMFSLMSEVRGDRDYSLETLYRVLCSADLLVNVGQEGVRFIHPLIPSYFAALALVEQPGWKERLTDILILCSMPQRLEWWEETIYALVELLEDNVTLFKTLTWITHHSRGPHTVLLARCLTVLPPVAERRIPGWLRQELVDLCIIRVSPTHEPSALYRAQIVSVLGSLDYTWNEIGSQYQSLIEEKLLHVLTERTRQTYSGMRHDYTEVRIAAAQALRTRFSVAMEQQAQATTPSPDSATPVPLHRLLQAWCAGNRDDLRTTFSDRSKPFAERTIAAFALGSLAASEEDVQLLLDCVVSPDESNETSDQGDMVWTATDALILFDASQVARRLTILLTQQQTFTEQSTRQLIYLAGRVRVQDQVVVGWLVYQLRNHDKYTIKARALQSLAWLGMALRTFDWLPAALRLVGLKIEDMFGLDKTPRALIHRVIKSFAAWDTDYLVRQGFLPQEMSGAGPDTTYLRRKAIQALAWVGDKRTIEELRPLVQAWDLPLRETWYTTVAMMESRLNNHRQSL